MQIQEGGRMLGQGRYGCAFEPALKCKKLFIKNKKTRTVGKLTSVRDGQTEYEVSEKLKNIPNADKYFTIISQFCKPLPRYKQDDPELDSCDILKDKKVNINSLVQLVMPFNGKPLYSVKKSPESINFFKIGRHILEAGALLLTKKIVHSDLHSANILVSSPEVAKLIDYGFAWSPEKLTLANVDYLARQFQPEILQEPPEVTYLQGLLSNLPVKTILYRIQEEKTLLKYIEKVYGISIKDQMNELKEFLSSSKVIKMHDYYSFYKLYWSKIDAWALGYDLITLYIEMMMIYDDKMSPDFESNKGNVLRAIRGLLETDPAKRLDAAEALEVWDPTSKVLQMDDVKEWLIKQKPIRHKIDLALH